MLSNNSPHSERFNQLLGELNEEVDALKTRITELEGRNTELRKELKEAEDRESDVFSSLKETDRIALKHQVQGLISKIDEHLEAGS